MRIIAGAHRGRKLNTLQGDATRPTLDSTREALFNILSTRVRDARVLDAFGGSGAITLEAISRGAVAATIFELAPDACKIISENIALCSAQDKVTLKKGDAITLLAKESEEFDLIFLDPPYRRGLADEALSVIAEKGLLGENGLIVVETGADEGVNVPKGLLLTRSRRYGRTLLHFIEYEGEEN